MPFFQLEKKPAGMKVNPENFFRLSGSFLFVRCVSSVLDKIKAA
jgi:hypothetical protein